MRKHAAWHVKGLRSGNEVGKKINVCNTAGEFRELLETYVRESALVQL
ncbi:hypothetical protein ABNN70_03450 [Sporolactobacillus sp. Y61]|uniref:Uncharacterized protein n=1 Tax=Sporolactobacillus sp. Y61 TaxID=3160863 RepID=A0AAU8IH50_9BACL